MGRPLYNIMPLKLISPLASPLSLKCEEGKLFTKEISEIISCVDNIEETTRPLLERRHRRIFKR